MTDSNQYLIPGTETMVSKSAHDIIQRAVDNDEPVFVIRARDSLSAGTLAYYVLTAEAMGADPEFVKEIREIHAAMLIWRLEHGDQVKMPTNG